MSAKVCICGRQALPGKSRCALHQAQRRSQAERVASQPWRAAYRDPEYRRSRELAWRRSGGSCEACGRPLTPRTFTCDHIVPLRDGGTHELGNLQVLCDSCNTMKTRRDRRRRAEAP